MASEHAVGGANAARIHDERHDFTDAGRPPAIAAIAAVVGGVGTLAAWLPLHLIRVFTNLFFQTFSDRAVSPAADTPRLAVIAANEDADAR